MITISFALLSDIDAIMKFMHVHWKKNHILSKNKELLLYEFKETKQLNFALAKDDKDNIVGLFGFIKYNSLVLPDIAGSLWKVIDTCKEPLLGLKLRKFVLKNIPHRFFSAPGAGLQTKPIYQVLKMNWDQMNHFYILNDKIKNFNIARVCTNIETYNKELIISNNISISKISSSEELESFAFNNYKHIVPFKDLNYLKKRFLEYPIYTYEVYKVEKDSNIVNIFVGRKVKHATSYAYRIVDFYGDETNINNITSFLYQMIIKNEYEYCDFISFGFSRKNVIESGFREIDFSSNEIIIPNYFEPFVQKNIPIYCVSDRNSTLSFRQCKADGDQDRPNEVL